MIKYIPQNTDIVGEIKRQFAKFINECESLKRDQKQELLKELGSNHFDDRFDASRFIEDAVGYSVSQWREINHSLAQLWQDIAKNNAMVNNTPFDVANETLGVYKDQFEIKP